MGPKRFEFGITMRKEATVITTWRYNDQSGVMSCSLSSILYEVLSWVVAVVQRIACTSTYTDTWLACSLRPYAGTVIPKMRN
jgi:hypothetical protein